MTRRILILIALITLPIIAQAQESSVGLLLGAAENASDGVDLNLKDAVIEAFYEVPLERGTSLRLMYGNVDTEVTTQGITSKGNVEYLDALISYEFDETYGSSSFGGIGVYRQKGDIGDESDYGYQVGVNGTFPVTRRFAFMAELAYHWANFEKSTSFLMATGGVRYKF